MRCAECGGGLPPATGRGRPRRYCSRGCQARAYRRRRDRGSAGRTAPRASAGRRPAAATGDPRDHLVRLAVEIADGAGLDAVSMSALAQRAGLPAHVLYRHVRNRSDLLAAMAERVIAARRPARAKAPPDPREQLERLAREEWAMYRRHPWLLGILATNRPPTGPAVLAMVDRTVAALTRAGRDERAAFNGYLVLSGYVQGMALLIEREPAGTTYRAWWSATLDRLERTGRTEGRPWLAAARRADPANVEADLDGWFGFGLGRLLDGLLA
ncbi:TetR/AcrR family transcriptional regulator [Phytohabitans sp. ZYX-F-186]|uniref:TetR/AcrR family transcriptional regulator n=1 Tax=Phytohabitans maris TaxID=3071409 RepID=A0ABU0ZFG6_9ACTN|nr:TetR/AcrR family transcriptional regulator [Phytohabitans sp. ZYX-F-186]MDQ7905803.1 TetR/AcrR family transcriptional regulator [Phytohabitans sp. ZYX-F-186]